MKKVLCVFTRFSRVLLFATPWPVALQAPLSVGCPRQESWSGLPCPLLQGIFPTQGWSLVSCVSWRRLCPAAVPPMGPRQRQHTLPTLPCPQGPSLALSNQTSRDEAPAPWDPGLMTVVFGAAPWGPRPCLGLLPAFPTAGDLVASVSQPCVCLALVCSGRLGQGRCCRHLA